MNAKEFLLFFPAAFLIITSFVCNTVKDKRINTRYGYRSELSMKNKQNWYFANRYMAKGTLGLGLLFFIIGILIYKFLEASTLIVVLVLISEFMAYIVLGITLENRLKSVHKR
ncbi:MAG: SdpI family protein [Anaerococcus sp.]|nr:SdpI family protein [Anaerococcus sp.]MDD7045262.1 SdpI family protein [Peptoniphilaceae bacterium]MDY2918414.1 SdpI family protein [Anaerococcus sp.]